MKNTAKKTNTTFLGSFPLYQGKKVGEIYTVSGVSSLNMDKRAGLPGTKNKPFIKIKGKIKCGSSRCFGWFVDRKEAIKAVKMNSGDIHEAEYDYCVIEKVRSGICGGGYTAEPIDWFIWIPNEVYCRGKWIRCEQPEWSKHIVNWWC